MSSMGHLLLLAALTAGLVHTRAAPSQISVSGSIGVYTPTSSIINSTDFSNYIVASRNAGKLTGVRLTPGRWGITGALSSTGFYVNIGCSQSVISPFSVDMSGSVVLMDVAASGWLFMDTCNYLTVTGPDVVTYQQDQYPITQGTILSSTQQSDGTFQSKVQIHAFFLPSFQRMQVESGNGVAYGLTYGSNGFLTGGNLQVIPGSVSQISSNTYTIGTKFAPGSSIFSYTMIPSVGGIYAMFSGNVVIQNVALYASNGVAFGSEHSTAAVTWRNTSVLPDPTPGPDGQLQQQSSVVNGFDCILDKVGPTIIGCTLQGTGDDTIDIGGHFATVVQTQPSNSALIISTDISIIYSVIPGDTINLYTPGDFTLVGSAIISVGPVSASNPGVPAGASNAVFGDGFGPYWKITLASFPPAFASAPFNSILTFPSASDSGTQVIGNRLLHNNGRGASVHALNAIIQGNYIQDVTAAISLGADTGYDGEAIFPTNMTVRDNYISNKEGILVVDFGFSTGQPINRGITLINNTLTNVQYDNMLVLSAGQVVAANNTALNPFCTSTSPTTTTFGFANFAPYVFVNVTGLTVSGNAIVQDSTCAHPQTNFAAPIAILGSSGVSITNQGPYPVLDTLASGQSLVSPGKIFSANGLYFLAPQSDGNLVLYNTTQYNKNQGGAVFATNSNTAFSLNPSLKSLNMQSNCNVQLIDTANGNLVYDFKNGNRGTPPCRLQVLNTGSFVVVDSLNVVWSVNGSPAQPSAGNFTMATGQSLPQGANITSADGSTYLIMQTNGYLSLVSATLAKQYPGSAAANLWMSSNSKSVSGPYVAVMQEDCNLVIYGGSYTAGGAPASANAAYGSGTSGKGVGLCSVVVSGANGGMMTIMDSKSNVVFTQPPGASSPSLSTTPGASPGAPAPPAAAVNSLGAGQSLAQGLRLYSPNALYYLTMQADGNLVLYNNTPGSNNAAVYATQTHVSPAPYTLTMGTDCNYRVFDGAGNVDFVTANTNRGAAPCRLQVTNAGTLQIVDASPYNVVWNTNNVPTAPALTSGILGQGQLLTQGVQLASTDGSVYLIAQSDGNVVLYNANLVKNTYGTTPAAAVWYSGSTSTAGPFTLLMQEDCNLVLYNLNYTTKGSSPGYAVWGSGTWNKGAFPCTLTLQGTSSNGGSLTVSDGTGKTIWTTAGQPLPSISSIPAGQALAQGSRLYSPNGQYFITLQSDGNLVSYNTASYFKNGASAQASVFAAYTAYASKNFPYSLVVTQNCNVLLEDATGATILNFGNTGRGTTPCHLQMLNSGQVAIVDSQGVTWNLNSKPAVPTTPGSMLVGQTLLQGSNLYSADQQVYLTTTSTGNLELINVAAYNTYGATPPSLIWQSQTSSTAGPFSLVMQEDCNLVMYNGSYFINGPVPQSAIYATGTSNKGTAPCSLNVSSAAGGSFSVIDSKGNVLFLSSNVAQPAVVTTISAGQSLAQGAQLFSANGQYFLTVQPDGNVVLYNTALYHQYGATAQANGGAFSSQTGGIKGVAPYSFSMGQTCNVFLSDSTGAFLYGFGSAGVTPCRFQVENNGTVEVIDSKNVVWSTNGVPTGPVAGSGVLAPGQTLTQGTKLYSPDGTVFLTPQNNGDLALYNTKGFVWDSGSSGGSGPYSLVMQEDCNLVLYAGSYLQHGPSNGVAIYASNTSGGSGCHLTVASTNGGQIILTSSNNAVIFQKP